MFVYINSVVVGVYGSDWLVCGLGVCLVLYTFCCGVLFLLGVCVTGWLARCWLLCIWCLGCAWLWVCLAICSGSVFFDLWLLCCWLDLWFLVLIADTVVVLVLF